VTGGCRCTLLYFSRLQSTYSVLVHTHGGNKKSQKRPSRRAVISVRSYTGIDRYERECVCVCLFFILYFLPFPSDRADCGIDFGRRICAGTPRVRDKSIKLTMWLRRQIFRRTNGGDMISDLNRPRADAVGRRDIIRLRRRRREKAGKKVYSGRRRKKKIKTKCAHT